jgi:hypothetical protein
VVSAVYAAAASGASAAAAILLGVETFVTVERDLLLRF